MKRFGGGGGGKIIKHFFPGSVKHRAAIFENCTATSAISRSITSSLGSFFFHYAEGEAEFQMSFCHRLLIYMVMLGASRSKNQSKIVNQIFVRDSSRGIRGGGGESRNLELSRQEFRFKKFAERDNFLHQSWRGGVVWKMTARLIRTSVGDRSIN